MRRFKVARVVVLLWLIGVGLWSFFLQPELSQIVAVAVAGGVVLVVSFVPSAPWWRDREQVDAPIIDQSTSLARQDWILVAGILSVAAVVAFAVVAVWPAGS